MGHMQTARMPMARGQHLEKSATVEPSKQAEGGEEDRRPNYKQTEKEQKNVKEQYPTITVGNLAPARSSEVAEKDVLEWVKNDKRRTHASWKSDVPEDRYSNAFLGYGREDSTLELTYTINTKITACLDPEGWRSVFGATSHAKEGKLVKRGGTVGYFCRSKEGEYENLLLHPLNFSKASTKVFTVKRPPPSSPLCEEATSSEKVLIDHPSEDPPRDPIAKSWLQVESTNDDLPSDKE
ncbi:hypothetical protein D5086_013788 [Populus alba]|uniref:Uncharacterized protein n=1 Tax=Populus alba TaxID=43335 RepID=A0ACC4C6C0_POPAL